MPDALKVFKRFDARYGQLSDSPERPALVCELNFSCGGLEVREFRYMAIHLLEFMTTGSS